MTHPPRQAIGFLGMLSATVTLTMGRASHPTGAVRHEVRMTGGQFLPRALEIRSGDTVAFRMVSGGPHNVEFWPDSIPTTAEEVLGSTMPDTIGRLSGPLLIDDETYVISFSGTPAGRYRYFCLPHVRNGMTGVITVREPKAPMSP